MTIILDMGGVLMLHNMPECIARFADILGEEKMKTLEDFYNLDVTEDHSTEVYVLEAKINYVETQYYTKLNITSADGGVAVTLYSSGAGQYAWLKDYYNKLVTIEIAPCNWNDKGFWAGCALAAYTADGKILNTLNFDTY